MKPLIAVGLLALAWASANATVSAADAAGNDWPRFRGPTGDGQSPAKGLPTTWSKDRNVLWRTDLPKPLKHENVPRKELENLPNAYNPWSSPIVSGGKVFLASAGVKREEHKLLCFDLSDGKPLWETLIPPGPIANTAMNALLENADWVREKDGPPRKNTHIATGYSICTPCTDGERVFVTFGTYVLAAVDFQGKILWQKPLAKTTDKPPSGGHYANETGVTRGLCMSTSPIIYRDFVIQICESEIMAFDCKTGDLKYKTEQRFGETWATPVLAPLKGRTLLVHHRSSALVGIDPETGKVIWTSNVSNYGSSPVHSDGRVFGYMGPSSPVCFAIAVDATGDSQPREPLWTLAKTGCTHSSPLILGSTLYRYGSCFGLQGMINGVPDKHKNVPVNDTSALYCIDAKTGNLACTIPLPGVSNFTSPVATADGYLYLATGGRSYVIKTGPKPEIVGTNELDDYNVGPSPAVVDGKLIIRGSAKLWCIGKP